VELLPSQTDRLVWSVAPAPQGGFLCSYQEGSENKKSCIAMFDSAGRLLQTITSTERRLNTTEPAVSRDGRYLFTNTFTEELRSTWTWVHDASISEWNLATGKQARTFFMDHEVKFFGISADDRYLLVPRSALTETHLDIWDIAAASLVRRVTIPGSIWINRVQATPDGKRVLLKTSAHGILVLSTDNLFPKTNSTPPNTH
jgi:hypothetical protein